ncbi:MAG: cytochrome c oxidase subunit II [bacterium]|nr:cytochrome c oxidase subunit II [bacterium]MCP4966085.1 cytochrome c oxidase subunit II [bacterium]
MVDSTTVLWGQTIVYSLYVVAILVVMGVFTYNITRDGKPPTVKDKLFYTFAGFLVVLGMSLHVVTYNTIPWVPTDVHRGDIEADKEFAINVADHEFQLPEARLMIDCEDTVLFNVTSSDLTYGFGLFRQDNSMVFQMQVGPGRDNEIIWEFHKNGVYSIRSTEYSGPLGYQMIVKDAVEVSGCDVAAGEGGAK